VLPGLAFRETLRGDYWRLDAPTEVFAIAMTFDARAPDLTDLVRERSFSISGTIDAERLATGRTIEGTLAMRFVQHGRLYYRTSFEGDDGHRYELGGQTEWSPLAPIASLTVLTASLYDASRAEVAHATLRFDARTEGWAMIKSLRLSSFG
jgi:hypothetical protein